VGADRSRFGRKLALATGIAVIAFSLAGGIALANASGHGSTPTVAADDQSPGPGQSADDHNGQGKQEPGEDGDHDVTASPGTSCDKDADDMIGATPRPSASGHEAEDAMVRATSSPKPSMSADTDRERCTSGTGGHGD
jgi:hypothetical protein